MQIDFWMMILVAVLLGALHGFVLGTKVGWDKGYEEGKALIKRCRPAEWD